ncbi:uncharacterized protein LOC111712172 [Eurytemora carolleeae]|uniref:uncharacterized protein LOC111712172 n=1 Tax=Eurytemora carolleeae TaxID=1294199 RepID=UPI000C78D089|nr:uncharacterized protein LOC111712172 [Eurytemora carolleeae]|eukprot:XP_023342485.1 uncharacterized protein LOC111712172 [Eurytemora affinis]
MRDKNTESLIGFGGQTLPREVLHLIFSHLDTAELKTACLISNRFLDICTNIINTRRNKSNMDSKKLQESNLPDLTEIISPNLAVPAALATTIPEVLTLQTEGGFSITVPQNAQIVVPVLPECIPLIAKVPDVVYTEPSVLGEPQEVKISQVLPGYPPSYASDYIPEQINSHSFNSFVNTISFNVSRYPTLSDVTDSKSYTPNSSKTEKGSEPVNPPPQKFDYVPAEFFSGPGSNFQTAGVRQAQSISKVPPTVLGSGRILTQMTTLPTCTLIEPTVECSSVAEDVNSRKEDDSKKNGDSEKSVNDEKKIKNISDVLE